MTTNNDINQIDKQNTISHRPIARKSTTLKNQIQHIQTFTGRKQQNSPSFKIGWITAPY